MKHNPIIVVVLVLCAVVAVLFLGMFAAPGLPIYASKQAVRLLLLAGSWTKFVALLTAGVLAYRSASALGRSSGAWGAWMTLAGGLGAYSIGQLILASFLTVTGVSPFPSYGDIFFLIAYPLLIIALVQFGRTYAASGFPTGGLLPVGIVTSIVAIAAAYPLLAPLARAAAAPLDKFLNLTYPLLDLLLLVPAVVLLALTARFQGGAVWRIWAALLAGVLFMVFGDIAYAWLSVVGLQQLDPLVHALYLVAYAAMALGTSVQYSLVAGERPPAPVLAEA